ncbi:MAG: lysophospholipid acyltransferase family protein [Candidatus Omnitrophota bacterium]
MLFFLVYQIGSRIALALPVRAGYAAACFLADLKYFFSRKERQEIIENLRLVLPGATEEELSAHARDIFRNFSKYLVDFFRFKRMDQNYVRKQVTLSAREIVDRERARGAGSILMTAHLGNWELGGAVMGILGYPMNVIALDHKNKRVNKFFVNQRQMKNERVISIGVALKKCFVALKKNEMLAILGDRDFTNHGVVVPFFGKDTLLPRGPAVFSLKTGAPIIPGFMIRHPDDHFTLSFEEPIAYQPTGDFEADVKNLTQLCGAEIERYIRKYPGQWYCFRKFWQ